MSVSSISDHVKVGDLVKRFPDFQISSLKKKFPPFKLICIL